MSTSISREEVGVSEVLRVTFTDETFTFHLDDKRQLTVPLWWYPRLLAGTPEQRKQYRILPGGKGVHWDAIDEDISVRGLLMGSPAPGAMPPVMDAAE